MRPLRCADLTTPRNPYCPWAADRISSGGSPRSTGRFATRGHKSTRSFRHTPKWTVTPNFLFRCLACSVPTRFWSSPVSCSFLCHSFSWALLQA